MFSKKNDKERVKEGETGQCVLFCATVHYRICLVIWLFVPSKWRLSGVAFNKFIPIHPYKKRNKNC